MANFVLPPIHLHARRIGLRARDALLGQERASVIGSTSRGLFLLLPQNRVVFLSVESYAGPLTVNMDREHPRLRAVQTGAEVILHPKHLEILNAGMNVDWSEAESWTAPTPPEMILGNEQRMDRLKAVVRAVLESEQPAGIVLICGPLLGLDLPVALSGENQSFLDAAQVLRLALSAQDLPGALAALTPLLGLGRGLTPSGDDFIEGLLLTLVRFKPVYCPFQQLDGLSQSFTELGYTQTTALSANLIEMAANGEADERLIRAVDGLFSTQPTVETCARDLLHYGSSSGTDALAGITVALTI